MINFIKNDFRSVREALGYLVRREVPVGIAILYYVIVVAFTMILAPFIWIGCMITVKHYERKLKRMMEA